MIDSDKLFEKYLKNWLENHKGEYTADEAEEMIPELYEKWVTTPSADTDGVSPEAYFSRVTDPQELVAEFIRTNRGDENPCSLLIDRITEVPECAEGLRKIATESADPKTVIAAMDILDDMGADQPLKFYAGLLTDETADEGVAEKAAEILKEHAGEVKEELIAAIPSATQAQKQVIADVLVETDRDDRTFALLKELFLAKDNVPFIAGLLGKYGDERAAAFLYPALDDSNYLEFMEIRNAIEQLGGVVDDTYRDFTDDPYYKAIKHLK